MKLKLTVASLCLLGFVNPILANQPSCPTPCEPEPCKSAPCTPAAPPCAPCAPIPCCTQHPCDTIVDPCPAQPTKSPCCDCSQYILDSMTQNRNRPIHPCFDWFKRIGISGGINVDGHWGNLDMGYLGENNRRVSVNDAFINLAASINDWTKAFASISFNNTTGNGTNANDVENTDKEGVYSNAYTNNRLDLEQGFITFGNFHCSPFFAQVGKQFQDFGRYRIHPIERTLTQVLSESLQTSGKIGFITPNGFHGSVYVFDDSLHKFNSGHTSAVFGGALGWDYPNEQFGYDIGIGYMSSFTGVNDVAYAINQFEIETPGADPENSYRSTVGAWNVYGDINSGPFSLGARFSKAAHKYSPTTLSTFFDNIHASGAQPWAADITAGYDFNACCKEQKIYVGYQRSDQAVNLLIPKGRWIAGYGIEIMKNTNLSAEYGQDHDYTGGNGGTGKVTNTFGARAAVKFG